MPATSFTLFATPIGSCAVVWGERGIVGLQLPEKGDGAARDRLFRRYPESQEAAPPAGVQRTIKAIIALLSGEAADLSFVELDLSRVGNLERRVYEIARSIPPGRTLTYGEVAKRIGEPDPRVVGRVLGANPFPIVVPCHRVLGADGKLGGFSAPGGIETKVRILAVEKARTNDVPALFDELPLAVKPRR